MMNDPTTEARAVLDGLAHLLETLYGPHGWDVETTHERGRGYLSWTITITNGGVAHLSPERPRRIPSWQENVGGEENDDDGGREDRARTEHRVA